MKTKLSLLTLFVSINGVFAINGLTTITNPLVGNQRSNAMAVDNNGKIYCGANNGLMKYENNTWTNYNTLNSSLNADTIRLLNMGGNNELVCVTNLGVSIFDGVSFVNIPYSTLGVNNNVNAIEKVQNDIWLGTNTGLFKFDGNSVTTYSVANNKLNNDTVLSIKPWNNELWVATINGLTKIDAGGNSYTYLSSNSGLKQNLIRDLEVFQNKLYIAYAPDNVDFINVQYFNGAIFSQLNDAATKVKIDRFYNIDKMAATPQGLILGDTYGELIYFNIITGQVESTGSNFSAMINIGWYAPGNSIAVSYKASNTALLLIDFNNYDCFGCENLPRNNKYIDINNVRAKMHNRGITNVQTMNYYVQTNPGYNFPEGIKSKIHMHSGLWLGGLDNNANLHIAAQTYRQNGDDFWPGPINSTTLSTDTITAIQYDKIWKISRFEIEEFKWAFLQGTVQNGSYTVPQDIIDWPANGNSPLNQNLAPFFDVNGDGVYTPLQHGDYPIIKGDQMLYWIFNDKLSDHTETNGHPDFKIGAEVHASVYAYQCDSLPDSLQVINNTLFYHFEIINKGTYNYNNFIVANFQDPDLQPWNQAKVASKPDLNLSYSYANTGMFAPDSMYNGIKVGTIILDGPKANQNDMLDNNNNDVIDEVGEKCLLNNSMVFRNDGTTYGNPQSAIHYYQYMKSRWKDNTPLTFGGDGINGSSPVRFAFDGQPWDTTTWNCTQSYDWRLVQSSGPVNFMIGDTIIFEYAIVNHLDSSLPWQSQTVFEDFFQDVHTIKNLYNQGNIPSCIALDVATKNNLLSNEIKVFPNPAQQYFVLQSNGENIEQVVIYDLNGRFVLQQQINALQAQIDIADLCNGMFFIQAATKSKNVHFKLMKSN